MAEAKLNFVEADLDHSSDLFNLYDRLYQGMVNANEVDPPAFPSSEDFLLLDGDGMPIFDADGNPMLDQSKEAQAQSLASQYADILMKNSAYLFANSILSVIGAGGQGSTATGSFVSRNGDSMAGGLQALHGFEAGYDNQKIFEVVIDASNNSLAIVTGSLRVSQNTFVNGTLDIGGDIAFDGTKTIYYEDGVLHIKRSDMEISGDIVFDGTFSLGDITINNDGIFFDSYEFYHNGNSNKSDVDWTMNDANVHGDLNIYGDIVAAGELNALNGFSLGMFGKAILYSSHISSLDESGDPLEIPYVSLDSDLDIINNHGIKINGEYVISRKNENVVSFSAPNMILNLGDDFTNQISLQTDVWDYSNSYKLLSKEGAGHIANGLIVQSACGGPRVMETFVLSPDESGVLFPEQIRFGGIDGPAIFRDENGDLNILMKYVNISGGNTENETLQFRTYFAKTDSLFRDLGLDWSATLHFDTDAEFICFDKPVEAAYFAIKSERYKTCLFENTLFFNDGKYIEGLDDGLRIVGNAYFDDNISSPSFASGFAGYGWSIINQVSEGGFHATFDSLTIRKKMRVYELEVQKISCTNGSLWVSDFCSGDEVRILT